MNKVVIYEREDGKGGVCLLWPATQELTIEDIALKDVPKGLRFKIVDKTTLPDDYFFDAWEYDFTNNDGRGMGHFEWLATQESKKK